MPPERRKFVHDVRPFFSLPVRVVPSHSPSLLLALGTAGVGVPHGHGHGGSRTASERTAYKADRYTGAGAVVVPTGGVDAVDDGAIGRCEVG